MYCQYVWDLRYFDAPVCRDRDENADGDCVDAGDEHLYYCQDANYNVTALADGSDGGVVERYAYDPYGSVTVLEADWSVSTDTVSEYGNEFLYCGYQFDPETGLLRR